MALHRESYISQNKCATCGGWMFGRRHRCPPAWRVTPIGADYDPDDPNEARIVYALDAEEAAEKFHTTDLATWGSDGYDDEMTVRVEPMGHDAQARILQVRTEVEYHSKAREAPASG